MNALELADKLETRVMSELPLKQAATMLRQQQAEIEEWKRKYKDMHNDATSLACKLLDCEKANFNKENSVKEVFNTEPLAWMRSDWSRVSLYEGDLCTIPLYTHPVKELTDEEKLMYGMLFMNWNRSLKEPLVKPAYEQYVFEQAIEILRKAQEK